MSYLVDIQSIPADMDIKKVEEMIKNEEFVRLIALGIRVQRIPNDKYACIKCSCHGVEDPKDCSC